MFDVARALVILWAAFAVVRTRVWLASLPLALTAYLFAVAVVGGFTIRSEGALEPMWSMLLVIVGPSALPRGRIPPVPFGSLIASWPLCASLVAITALLVVARGIGVRESAAAASSPENERLGRIVLALWLVAGFEGLNVATRALPLFLDRGGGAQSL
jgi:hypothetical protein